MPDYKITFARSARKELQDLPLNMIRRIVPRIDELTKTPRPSVAGRSKENQIYGGSEIVIPRSTKNIATLTPLCGNYPIPNRSEQMFRFILIWRMYDIFHNAAPIRTSQQPFKKYFKENCSTDELASTLVESIHEIFLKCIYNLHVIFGRKRNL